MIKATARSAPDRQEEISRLVRVASQSKNLALSFVFYKKKKKNTRYTGMQTSLKFFRFPRTQRLVANLSLSLSLSFSPIAGTKCKLRGWPVRAGVPVPRQGWDGRSDRPRIARPHAAVRRQGELWTLPGIFSPFNHAICVCMFVCVFVAQCWGFEWVTCFDFTGFSCSLSSFV